MRPVEQSGVFASPVGPLGVAVDEGGAVTRLSFGPLEGARYSVAPAGRFEPVFTQLAEYFDGRRRRFELSLAPRGTDFQRQVWEALLRIPFGATTSYGALAAAIGRPGASRAVGLANGANPIAIIVPCHRVIGADRSLTGFGGGLSAKAWLLHHEGAASLAADRITPRTKMEQLGLF